MRIYRPHKHTALDVLYTCIIQVAWVSFFEENENEMLKAVHLVDRLGRAYRLSWRVREPGM